MKKLNEELTSASHLLRLACTKSIPRHPLVYWLVDEKCQPMAAHISNVNPQEDVLEQFSQSVWLRLRRAACVGNWSSSRGMTLSLDSGS